MNVLIWTVNYQVMLRICRGNPCICPRRILGAPKGHPYTYRFGADA